MNLLNKILTIVFICFLALFYFSRKKPLECRHYEYIYEAAREEEAEEETELSEEQRIAKIQEIIGADPDGVWGNKSEAKLREYLGIEVQVQRTRQTQNVVNGFQDIRNDIVYVDVTALRTECEALVSSGDFAGALGVLQVCEGAPCWSEVSDLWVLARDWYVYQRHEAAAERFIATQGEPPDVRLVHLREVEAMLLEILEEHPETQYTAAIHRHIKIVRATILSLDFAR